MKSSASGANEDVNQLRAFPMPETAYVEIASFSDEETLYVLTNVPQINRDEWPEQGGMPTLSTLRE